MRRRAWLSGLAAMPLGLLAGASRADSYEDFFLYISLDRPDAVSALLRKGFDINARNPRGQHGLYVAIKEDSPQCMALLVDWPGLDPESPNAQGETLLMMAAIRGQMSLMARLVAHGATINRTGWTPLHYAASGGGVPPVEYLLAQGAEMEARAPNGGTALMMAAGYGTIDSARLLLQRGADPRLLDAGGRRARDYAIKAGRDGLVKELDAREAALGRGAG